MKKRNLVLFGTVATLSLALAGSIGTVAASAAELSNGGSTSGTTTVTYTVADSWKVTIPETINIAEPNPTTDKVSASDVKIANGTSLTVTVESQNDWNLRKAGEQSGGIAYELKADSGSALTDGATVLEVEAGTTSGEAALTATVKEDGSNENYSTGNEAYTDTLTFSVDVE